MIKLIFKLNNKNNYKIKFKKIIFLYKKMQKKLIKMNNLNIMINKFHKDKIRKFNIIKNKKIYLK